MSLWLLSYVQHFEVRVGISAVEQASSSIGWAVSVGAIGMAIDRFRQLGIADDFDFEFIVEQTTCNASYAVGDGLNFMTRQNVDVVIAPPCKMGAVMMAHLSTVYKNPALIWDYVTDSDFSNEQKYPWLTSITVNSKTLGVAVVATLEKFAWSTIAILYTNNDYDYCDSIVQSIMEAVSNPTTFTPYVAINSALDLDNDKMVTAIMEEVRQRARIVLLCSDANRDRRRLLIKASQMNMVDDEYQYIVVAIRNIGFVNNGMTPFWEDVDGKYEDEVDDVVRSLAKKMLIIDLSSDVKDQAYLAEFRANVANRVKLPPLNCDTPRCLNTTGLTMGRYARHLYDLFFLYGLALQNAGRSYKNAQIITDSMVTSFSDQVAFAVITISGEKESMKKLYTDAASTVFANRASRRPHSVPICGFSGLDCPLSFFRHYIIFLIVGIAVVSLLLLTLALFAIFVLV
ncbi:hypothetical protein Aduo_011970 [Ancylostoma duodenale]